MAGEPFGPWPGGGMGAGIGMACGCTSETCRMYGCQAIAERQRRFLGDPRQSGSFGGCDPRQTSVWPQQYGAAGAASDADEITIGGKRYKLVPIE